MTRALLAGVTGSRAATASPIIRAGSGQFPATYENSNLTTIPLSGLVLGPAGSLLVIYVSAIGTMNVTSVTATDLEFTKSGAYAADPGFQIDIEQWWAKVPSALAGTTVTVNALLSAETTFGIITADSLVSTYGANTVWTPGTFTPIENASSTNISFPSITSGASGQMAYLGMAQTVGVTPAGGDNPISGLQFQYTTTAADNIMAFNGALAPNTSYAPVALAPSANESASVANVWTAAPTPTVTGSITYGGRATYGNSGNSEQAVAATWGFNPAYAWCLEFLNQGATWGTWPDGDVWNAIGGWADFLTWPGLKMVKVPIQVTSTPLLWTDITGGGQDANFTSWFGYCYTNNVRGQVFGWEPNQSSSTYAWGCAGNDTPTNQAGYKATIRHLITLAEDLYPGFFTYFHCLSTLQNPGMTTMGPGGPYDPGVDVIDYYTFDVYNVWFGTSWPGDPQMLINLESGFIPNWNQWFNYCVQNSKGIGFLEWGLYPTTNGTDGAWSVGDDVPYVNNSHGLIRTAASAPYNLDTVLLPWTQATGNISSFVNFPNATAAGAANVASDVAAGLTAAPPTDSLQITSVNTQNGTVGTPYNYTLTSTGGVGSLTYSASTLNPLPNGLSLNSDGVISGTPTTAENAMKVTVSVIDSDNNSSTTSFTFNVAAASALLPTGPTGAFVLNKHDEFDDSPGSSGPTNGLNNRLWNTGFFSGPAVPGNVAVQNTVNAEGNTNNYHGPSVNKLPGDGTLHMQGISPGPDNGGSYSGRTFECGGVNTAGLLAFNPANVALGSTLQAAANAGTVTVLNGPCAFEIKMRWPGPNTDGNSPAWWPTINFYNGGDFAGGSYWPGGTSWLEEIDFWEGSSDSLGIVGRVLTYKFHQGTGNSNIQPISACSPATQTTDLSLAMHTYTVYMVSNTQIQVWFDGVHVFTDTSSTVAGQFVYPQYLNFCLQVIPGAGLPPNTNITGRNDAEVEYFRTWTI